MLAADSARDAQRWRPFATTKPSGYKLWRKACDEAGVTNRSLHSARHTFVRFVAKRNRPRGTSCRTWWRRVGTLRHHQQSRNAATNWRS